MVLNSSFRVNLTQSRTTNDVRRSVELYFILRGKQQNTIEAAVIEHYQAEQLLSSSYLELLPFNMLTRLLRFFCKLQILSLIFLAAEKSFFRVMASKYCSVSRLILPVNWSISF